MAKAYGTRRSKMCYYEDVQNNGMKIGLFVSGMTVACSGFCASSMFLPIFGLEQSK